MDLDQQLRRLLQTDSLQMQYSHPAKQIDAPSLRRIDLDDCDIHEDIELNEKPQQFLLAISMHGEKETPLTPHPSNTNLRLCPGVRRDTRMKK